MNKRTSSKIGISVALGLLLFLPPLRAQEAAPDGHLVAAYLLTDLSGTTKGIQTEFEVKSSFVVAKLLILYRTRSATAYRPIKLKKTLNLDYVGTLPASDRIEYYLVITPEKGESMNLIGTPTNPSVIPSSDLESKIIENPSNRSEKRAIFISIGVGVVVGVILGVFGVGREKAPAGR